MDFSIEVDQSKCSPSPKAVQDLRWKRALDALLILLALPLLIPLALLVALLIRSVSRGSVLFRQERVGYQGRRFLCFKFRTMFVDADSATHQGHLHQLMNSDTPMQKLDSEGDPRIIPFGVWLRASGLDELPQLINVLRGEMSLVGPRPCLPYEYAKYLSSILAEGAVSGRARLDRALAGERKKQDHLRGNGCIGYHVCEKQNSLVGFENHPDDRSSLGHSNAGDASVQKSILPSRSPKNQLFQFYCTAAFLCESSPCECGSGQSWSECFDGEGIEIEFITWQNE
jgi:lipopolysaccharide/colanic/teichoic acid biosynthesis glycosyltransferase